MSKTIDILIEDAATVLERINLDVLSGKSVLITGASGLIGTALLACLRRAVDVMNMPVSVCGVIHSEPQPYLRQLTDHPCFQLVQGDLTDPAFCGQLPLADFVIHAAGYGQPGRFMEDPVRTLALNSATTLYLVKRLNPGGSFLFVSSSEVYSGLAQSPHRESDIGTTTPTHPRACYIEGKRCGEAICNALRLQGVNAKSARLALAYGPGARKGDARVLNAFIERGLEQGCISLQDDGLAWRTYCYTNDAVEILWHILLNGTEAVYNVGGTSRTTIADLARTIGELLQVPVSFPQRQETLAGAPTDVCLNMEKVEHEFGKREYLPLKEGLIRTIEWQKRYRDTV